MKIGIDISQISYKGTGVSRFTEGLLDAILKHDKKNQWIFFYSSFRNILDPDLKKKIQSTPHTCHEYKLPPTLLAFLWNTLHIIPIEMFLGKLDLFISSDWTQPPSFCKKMTIVHDLTYVRYPETVHANILKTQRQRMFWVKKEIDHIITDSQSTKNDVVSFLKMNDKNIDVIYPGIAEFSDKKMGTSTPLLFKKPFILTVGKIEPRKNILRLLQAYNQLPQINTVADLVVVGESGWEDNFQLEQHLTDRIHFLGRVSDNELSTLYGSCEFFIYPSLWEGFGYPVVEAMRCGAAVATSNTSSLKEIAENAAVMFDPFNIQSIQDSMLSLIKNDKLRLDLQKKGTIRAKDFTWGNYYQQLMGIINKLI